MEISNKGLSELLLRYVYDNIEIVLIRRLVTNLNISINTKYQYYLKVKKLLPESNLLLIRSGRITSKEILTLWELITKREVLVDYCMDVTRRFKLHVVNTKLSKKYPECQ